MAEQPDFTPKKIFSKKCPYCSTILTLAETTCHACKKKVGDPDQHGIATIPGKWKSYVAFLIALGILAGWFYAIHKFNL